jgi:chromosome segregation ATPase
MPTLVYSDADGVDRSFALGPDPVIVGRGPECAIQSNDPRVSRQHARFFVDQGALWVEDLGSSNGIYVGPNKVQRAPVPTGEIILVGSLVIRLLPASGTLPPPNGLHGTLAAWLDLERKTRAAVEEERDAFARRVGEMHQTMAALKELNASPKGSNTLPDGSRSPFATGAATHDDLSAEAARLEADAQVARLEQALAAMQDENEMLRRAAGDGADADLVRLRDELAAARARIVAFELEQSTNVQWSGGQLEQKLTTLQNTLDEAEAARSIAEHAAAEAQRDSISLRQELDELRRTSAAELEIARLDVQKTRDKTNMAETIAGTMAAERLAESDMVIAGLQRDLEQARVASSGPDLRVRELQELNAVVLGRAEKAEKELAAAQIRAQGAERNLAHANTQAAKAETRTAQVEGRLDDAEGRAKAAEAQLQQLREHVAGLERAAASQQENLVTIETRGGAAADADLAAAEAKLTKVVIELEAQKTRVAEHELSAGERVELVRDAEARVAAARAEATAAQAKLAEVEQRAVSLQARVEQLGRADSVMEAASRAKQDATDRAAAADQRVIDAERRSEDAEKRASAADTMAKAMAKDVAEALRRAAEADIRARSVVRELTDAKTRAESAETVREAATSKLAGAEQRAADAEAAVARVREELEAKLAATESELTARQATAQADLSKKLEATQRELAAERSTALAMVDRKAQLERELGDSRGKLPEAIARADEAEKKLAEAEIQIESLQDRVLDLESGMAVSETAQQASLAEAREEIKSLKLQLVDTAAETRKLVDRVAELEELLADSERALAMVDGALREAKNQIGDLERAAQSRSDSDAGHQERLEDALARAGAMERQIEELSVQAEQADMAIGRAGALQRQLDEALSKLAWLERNAQASSKPDPQLAARLADAEARAKDIEARYADADRRAQVAQAKQQELVDQVAKLERRAPERDPEAERRYAEALERVAALEREVAAADNVRSFAAETEREIAQLQRELREVRSKVTQVTLERDRLAIEVRDARINDDETTGRRTAIKETAKPAHDPEATGVLDVAKMESIIARASEAEHKLVQAEREVAALRTRLADTEERLRAAIDREDDDDSESTRTGSQLPIVLGEHVSILEESIDSLRANMRAASDETAIMDQTESVVAVASAVSQAAEHVERARAAIRALAAAIGMAS